LNKFGKVFNIGNDIVIKLYDISPIKYPHSTGKKCFFYILNTCTYVYCGINVTIAVNKVIGHANMTTKNNSVLIPKFSLIKKQVKINKIAKIINEMNA
jgi:hypothetical protein